MPYNSRAVVVRLRYETKSNVNLGGFRFQIQAFYVSSHTEQLWYNETDCRWKTIYIYIYVCVCHPQTRYFVVSQLINVARQAGSSNLSSRSEQLFTQLNFYMCHGRPQKVLDHANINSRHKWGICTNSSQEPVIDKFSLGLIQEKILGFSLKFNLLDILYIVRKLGFQVLVLNLYSKVKSKRWYQVLG